MDHDLGNYHPYKVYYGDIHNHCGLSYGRGSLLEALKNAQLQLDFASVTVHAVWPDLPLDDPELKYVVDYHQKGFSRAIDQWPSYLRTMDEYNHDGEFVTFPSYEWHSNEYGDYCVYFKKCEAAKIIPAKDLPSLRQAAQKQNSPVFLIPHHIGYKTGSRGINWGAFTNQVSPVAEIFSFHGLSESTEGVYPYLHSMGPCDENSTAQHGWSLGKVFGIIGSTDHHNAFPGCYGYGRLAVWANGLNRDAIWEAIANRRTYALTGDRIELSFQINGHIMGEICPPSVERYIEVAVVGGDAIDYIDVLHNNHIIHRECIIPKASMTGPFIVHIEMGWGEKPEAFPWEVEIEIVDGELMQVEPRFRGFGPTDNPSDENYSYNHWEKISSNCVKVETRTRKNISLHTPATEGIALVINGNERTHLRFRVNGRVIDQPLLELMQGSRSHYMGGFLSPALYIHRAVPKSEYTHTFSLDHRERSFNRDWYYIRVRQRNNQWAWSSPIWLEGLAGGDMLQDRPSPGDK